MEYIKIISCFAGWPQIIELLKNLYSFSAKRNKLLDYTTKTELYSFLNDKLKEVSHFCWTIFQIFLSACFVVNFSLFLFNINKHEISSRSQGPQCGGLCQVVNAEDYVR